MEPTPAYVPPLKIVGGTITHVVPSYNGRVSYHVRLDDGGDTVMPEESIEPLGDAFVQSLTPEPPAAQ